MPPATPMSAAKFSARCSRCPVSAKEPVAVPSGRHRQRRRPDRQGQGPEGRAFASCCPTTSRSSSMADRSRSIRATRPSARASQWGTSRTLVANLIAGVTKGFEQRLEINGVGYRAAVQGKNLQTRARLQPRHRLSDPGRHHDRDAAADRDRDHRHRQAEGRPGRGRNPRLPAARALQGQGHQICGRAHLPQGRQEEVTEPTMSRLSDRIERRKGRVRGSLAACRRRAQAAFRVPLRPSTSTRR